MRQVFSEHFGVPFFEWAPSQGGQARKGFCSMSWEEFKIKLSRQSESGINWQIISLVL